MPSKKSKAKQQASNALAEEAHVGEDCSCTTYDFSDKCLNEATAAKIVTAFPNLSFRVDVCQAGHTEAHLDENLFRYPFAEPDFRPLVFGNKPILNVLAGVMEDMQQIKARFQDLLFAATYVDGTWLDSDEAKQVAASFTMMKLVLHRFIIRIEELKEHDLAEEGAHFTKTAE